jgi:quercetin dioxygenase-like cupin family protein
MKSLRMIIGTAAAAALIGSTVALATPGSGFSPSGVIVGHFGTFHLDSSALARDKDLKWSMILKTSDDTDVGTDKIDVAAGGSSGWHSHPSAVFVTVTQGSIVWTNGSDPLCPSTTYTEGQSFIEQAYVIHNVRNASNSATAQFFAQHINPTGTSGPPFRIDVPTKPNNCP